MFEKLEIFKMAFGLASHSAARQTVIARNVAHADTPDYRATDIASFADTYDSGDDGFQVRVTRAKHSNLPLPAAVQFRSFETDDQTSPNGNSVSLETEMVKASETRYQHELALSIYSTSLNILRTSLGRR